MVKRAAKRQKTTSSSTSQKRTPKSANSPVRPTLDDAHFAALEDDEAKDDEERRLESVLFGTPYVPALSIKGKEKVAFLADAAEDESGVEEGGGKEFENMLDADLFMMDDGPTKPSVPDSIAEFLPDDETDDDEVSHTSRSSRAVSPTGSDYEEPPVPSNPSSKTRNKAAWVDEDDAGLEVSIASSSRLRKLRDAPDETALGGREYERRLRRQFERIHPAPAWASRRSGAKRVRGDGSDATSEEEDEEDVEHLLKSTGGIVGSRKGKILEKGSIAISRLRDANTSATPEGGVTTLSFHPSPNVPVLAVASSDRRLRLYSIDGHTNPHLHTLHTPSLPTSHILFHPSGTQILLAGQRPFFHTYDLNTGASTRSPRGLWGTSTDGDAALSLEKCAFSPDGGLLAVAGRSGNLHIVDFSARSAASHVVATLKAPRPTKAVWWGSQGLLSLSDDAEVCVWDVGGRRCVRRWKDDGAFGASTLEADRAGRQLAIGSSTGFVSLYGSEALDPSLSSKPKALKTLGNLTTSISSVRFNSDGQLLAIASKEKKDQLRLIHTPSQTAYANWPTSGTPLGHVSAVDFSAGSEYLVTGNNRGRVLLYQLRDYSTQ